MADASFYSSEKYRRYCDHLHSEYWLSLKERRLAFCGRKCEQCGETREELLEQHHLHYRTIFAEGLGDVQILCARCHSRLSGTIRGRPELQPPEIPDDCWDGIV